MGGGGTLSGLFMALQPRIIACGNSIATFAMAVRFLTGPAVMAAASIAVGLRGVLLHVAIVQVPLSLSIYCIYSLPHIISLFENLTFYRYVIVVSTLYLIVSNFFKQNHYLIVGL